MPLIPAQDFKRVGDGDAGPNTGGMGAYAPMPHVDAAAVDDIMETAVRPLVEELRRRGIDYRGVLYAGLMLTADGPKVIEYNVRFGDPETQVVLPLLDVDAAELFLAVANGDLDGSRPPAFSDDAAVCVVLASPGYPERPAWATPSRAWTAPASRPPPSTASPCSTPAPAATTPTGPSTRPAGACSASTAVAPTLAEARAMPTRRRTDRMGGHADAP